MRRVAVYRREGTEKLYIRYRNASGRIVREATGTEDAARAGLIAEEKERELIRAEEHGDDKAYKEAAVAYLTGLKKTSTFNMRRSAGRRWDPLLADLFLREITEKHVLQFIDLRRTQNVTDATIRAELDYLSAVLAYNGVKPKDNVVRQLGPMGLKRPQKIVRYLTRDEEEQLLKHCLEPWQKRFVILAIETGLRMRELLKLRSSNVHLNRRELTVPAESSKTGQPRVVPLSDRALREFQEQDLSRECAFPVNEHKDAPRDHVYPWWSEVKKAAGIKCRWHDLRHTFASRWVQDGGTLAVLSKVLGHADISMTMRYAHLATEDLHYQVQALDALRKAREEQAVTDGKHGSKAAKIETQVETQSI